MQRGEGDEQLLFDQTEVIFDQSAFRSTVENAFGESFSEFFLVKVIFRSMGLCRTIRFEEKY